MLGAVTVPYRRPRAGVVALADSIAWLFAARDVQGLSVAMISGTAMAALSEPSPERDSWRSALTATLALSGGTAIGPILGGALAQWASDRLVTPFLAGIALIAVFALAGLTIPETVTERTGGWRIQRPGVPAEIRGAFTRIGVTGAAVWSAGMRGARGSRQRRDVLRAKKRERTRRPAPRLNNDVSDSGSVPSLQKVVLVVTWATLPSALRWRTIHVP